MQARQQKALTDIADLMKGYKENPDQIKEFVFGMCSIKESLKDPYLPTHYELLGIPSYATDAEIKTAYRKMSLKLHPDKNPNDKDRATRYFSILSNAYETLANAGTRAIYDAACHKTEKLQERSATNEHKTEWALNVSKAYASYIPEAALVPTAQRSLYALFEDAHFFDDKNQFSVMELCKKNLAIALAAFEEESIRTKLSSYFWEEIGLAHIEIAKKLCLLEHDDTLYILKKYNFRIFQRLAKQHDEICLILLGIPAIDQLWDSDMLNAFLTQHANSVLFPEIQQAINTNAVLKNKIAHGMRNIDELAEEKASDFVIKNWVQILESPEKYFSLLWPHRRKIMQQVNLYNYLGMVKRNPVIANKIKHDISVDDLVKMTTDQVMECVAFDPPHIAKLILTNTDKLTAEFSGAHIDVLKKALGDDAENINHLIMANPALRQRYDAWIQLPSLLNTQDALLEQKVEACITEGKLSSTDIFGCFLPLVSSSISYPSVGSFFDSERLRKYISEDNWISLASLSPEVCLKLLRSPSAEKVTAANLNHWIKLYGADVLFCIEENSKLQQMMSGYDVLHQSDITPQRSVSLTSETEAKQSQKNLTLLSLQQLRIAHVGKIQHCEPLYSHLEELVTNDPDRHLTTLQQRHNFIKLMIDIITNSQVYNEMNKAIEMPKVISDSEKENIKLKQELITRVKAIYLQELHSSVDDIKLENSVNILRKSFHLSLGEFLFQNKRIESATKHFKAVNNLAEQSREIQFYARVCLTIVEARGFETGPQPDITTLEMLKTRLSTILTDPLAQTFPDQMVLVRSEILDLDKTTPALCLQLKNQSENTELKSETLKKAKTLFEDAFKMSNWITGQTPNFFAQSHTLLAELVNIAQDDALNHVKAYLMAIYWIRGEFKKAYDLGIEILPADKITSEAKDASVETIMVANRLGFCLLQPELQEQYQKDKTLAENYFKYAARMAPTELAESALAAIGKTACLEKEKNVTEEQMMQVFMDTQEKAKLYGKRSLSYLSYQIVACSQVINLLQTQSKEISIKVKSLTRLIPTFVPYVALPIPPVLLNEEVLNVFKQSAQRSRLHAPTTSMVPLSDTASKLTPVFKH
ncbi:MAG: J domain-containing protein [Gammaproteobacteria bacterium]